MACHQKTLMKAVGSNFKRFSVIKDSVLTKSAGDSINCCSGILIVLFPVPAQLFIKLLFLILKRFPSFEICDRFHFFNYLTL